MSVLITRAALCAAALFLALVPSSASAAVTPTVDGQGNLNITGDGANDTITITAADGFLAVNGTATTATADPARSITVDAGAGTDTVDLSALTAAHYRQSLLRGGDDVDTLAGGAGHDRVLGDRGNDTLSGNAGNDVLVWNNGDGTDVDTGGDGADEVEVNGSTTAGDAFTIKPGAAAGRVQFDRTNLVPFGIDVSAERLTVNGLGGDDTMTGADDLSARTLLTLNGGTGLDVLTGGDGADLITGGDDNDTLDGAGGGDRVIGDRGTDVLRGGTGDDVLVWNNGDGSDTDTGGDGVDRVEVNGAGAGDAFTITPNGAKSEFKRTNLVPFTLDVDAEQLEVNGLGGDDTLTASDGLALAIVADGGAGNDTLTGANEIDALLGGSGNDALTGGGGADAIDGQDGDDTLSARDGVGDLVRGGVGNDSAQTDRKNVDVVDGVEKVDALPEQAKPHQPKIGTVKLSRKGSRLTASIRLTCPAAEAGGCKVSVTLTSAKRKLGSGKVTLKAGQTRVLKVKLAAGALRLAKGGKLAVRQALVSTDAAGNAVSFTRSHKLGVPRSSR